MARLTVRVSIDGKRGYKVEIGKQRETSAVFIRRERD
jgi:flagellar motor switch protein FliM